MDHPIQFDVGRCRLLRRGRPRSGAQQISGPVEWLRERADALRMIMIGCSARAPSVVTIRLLSSSAERVESCSFTFSSRKRGKVCRPSRAISQGAGCRTAMVPGSPLGRSGRITLRPINSLAMRLRKQSTLRDFSSGAWSRKLKTAPDGKTGVASAPRPSAPLSLTAALVTS